LVWNAPEAGAFWGHSGGGSWGSSGGSWGSSGGSYGSSGGSYGSIGYASSGGSYGSSGGYYSGGWGGRHHHRHHRHAYYGSWGSSGGSWGSSGGSYYGSWGSGGGSWGSSGGSWGSMGGVVVETAPAAGVPASPPPAHPSDMPADGNLPPIPGADADMPDDTAPAAPVDNGAGLYRRPTSATLTVRVPADARVFVNGLATTSTGSVRRYVSNGLRDGYNYTYSIRAEIVRDGQTITETQAVKLQAGDAPSVEFAMNAANAEPIANQPVRTSVTLNVPADAKVYLSGNETQGTGAVRTFSTTKLAAGQVWGNYVVRVEVQRNGRTLGKEETIAINGGETRELTIDVDAPQVARAGN
jgi:uncharacterized protein (TIGR03000 family)